MPLYAATSMGGHGMSWHTINMQPADVTNPTLDLNIGPKGSLPAIDVSSLLPVLFMVVCFIWAIYTLIIAYHWFRYGHRSWLAVPSLVLHLVVSVMIILFAVSGLR